MSLEQATMLIICFISLAPLYAMVATALKTTEEFAANFRSVAPPAEPTFEKFAQAWSGLGFAQMTRNSVILAVTTATATVFISSLAGYALAHLKVRGRRWFLIGIISLLSVPAIVMIVPLFDLFSRVGIVNRYPSAIIAMTGIAVPFGTYLVYTFMKDIPRELIEAAVVDGATNWQVFWHITLPVSRPAIMTVALVSGVWAWNDLLVPLVMWQDRSLQVLMVGLANLAPGRAGAIDIPLAMAGVTISVTPILVLFLLMQRVFVRGFLEGSLK